MSTLEVVDIVVILAYLGLIFTVGMATTCRPNRGTSAGYFLAGRDMTWILVGGSLFASNIGSYHFIGLAGSGAAAGWGAGAYELNALYFLQLLGWIMLPVYMASAIYTMPEYLAVRFGRIRLRIYYSVLSLLLYIFTKISVDLYSGAVFIQETLDWNIAASITFLLILTAIYTVLGGLAAVIWTDTANFIVMMVGGIILMIIAFVEVGGMQGVLEDYPCAVPNETLYGNDTCGIPREDSFRMFRHPVGSDMPFFGFVLGQSPASIWYWCADQVIVQRALAAKNLSHAKGGTLLAGYFKIIPTFMIVIPGMIARMLWPDEIACVDDAICEQVCSNPSGCTDIAYPRLVMELLPKGLRGLMIAVVLAALMSSLTSIFNSGATIFVVDLWKLWRKKAGEKESMIVGRIFVLFLVCVSILWLPVVANSQGGQLWHYIQEVTGYLSPPIAAVFLMAMLWHGVNEPGMFWSLMIALFFGCMRFIFMIVWPTPDCGEEDTRPYFVRVHYFYIATMLFWCTLLLCWIISKCTKQRIPENMYQRLTYWTRHSTKERISIDELYNPLAENTDADTDAVTCKAFENQAYSPYPDSLPNDDLTGLQNDTSDCLDVKMAYLDVTEKNLKEPTSVQLSDKIVATTDAKEVNGLSEVKGQVNHDVCTIHVLPTSGRGEAEVQCDISEDFNLDQIDGVTKYGSLDSSGPRKRKTKGARAVDATWKYCCGVSSQTDAQLSEDDLKMMQERSISIKQTEGEKLVLNINLFIILVVGAILYVLFGFLIDRLWKASGTIDCPQYYQ